MNANMAITELPLWTEKGKKNREKHIPKKRCSVCGENVYETLIIECNFCGVRFCEECVSYRTMLLLDDNKWICKICVVYKTS